MDVPSRVPRCARRERSSTAYISMIENALISFDAFVSLNGSLCAAPLTFSGYNNFAILTCRLATRT